MSDPWPPIIPSHDLAASQVPGAGASWNDIVRFAATFDREEYDHRRLAFQDLDALSAETPLVELRAQLFMEYRRWNHFGRPPEGADMQAIQHLMNLIRHAI